MSAALHLVEDAGRAATMLHPLRLRILGHLTEPDSSAGVARRLGLPRQVVNYHLRQLEDDRLVAQVGERQKRGCTERLMQTVAASYLISPAALGPLATDPEQVRDKISSTYLMAVAGQVIREVGELRSKADAANKRLPTLTLQADVRFASPAAQQGFARELTRQLARLVRKYHDERSPSGRRFRVVAGAYPAPRRIPAEDGAA
jgi:DNA-binding transcriptional ArsR family regulator